MRFALSGSVCRHTIELGEWTTVSAEAQLDQSLRIQCHRMIRLLRSLLQMPTDIGSNEEGGIDG